jgi:hypothetical protein
MNAHLFSNQPKKKFIFLQIADIKKMALNLLLIKSKLDSEDIRIQMLADNTNANTGGLNCEHDWVELISMKKSS